MIVMSVMNQTHISWDHNTSKNQGPIIEHFKQFINSRENISFPSGDSSERAGGIREPPSLNSKFEDRVQQSREVKKKQNLQQRKEDQRGQEEQFSSDSSINISSILKKIGKQMNYPRGIEGLLDRSEMSNEIEDREGQIPSEGQLVQVLEDEAHDLAYDKIQNLKRCLQFQQKMDKESDDTITLLNKIGVEYHKYGQNIKSIEYYSRCLQIQERKMEKDSIGVNIILNNIGNAYSNMGDYQKAIEYYFQCLQIQERVAGKGSINSATTLNNIGITFKKLGQGSIARDYYLRCLQILGRMESQVNMDYATTLNNIGNIYKNQGDTKKAIEYYFRCLKIQESIKGKGSIHTASTLNSIGNAYKNQRESQQALKYYFGCLEIQETTNGKGNIDAASTLNNIGSVYGQLGHYSKAIEYYDRSLQIIERITGRDSISISPILNNIGTIYFDKGDNQKAIEYYSRCLQIQQKVNGKGSIDTSLTMNSIGNVYFDQGDYSKAIEHYFRSLEIIQRIQGKGTISCTQILNNIGSIYKNQGHHQFALKYYFRCLQIQQQIKGKGNIDTYLILDNIGSVYFNEGNYPQALKYYSKSLEISQRVFEKNGNLGTICTDTLTNIGDIYFDQGYSQKSLQYYSRCLEIYEKTEGKGSIGVASTIRKIGTVFFDQGNYPKALQYFQSCLNIQENIKGKETIDTALTLYYIGNVHKNMTDYSKAIDYYFRCLNIQEMIKGKGSIDTASTFNCIGNVYFDQGDNPKAIEYYLKCLEIQEKFKGKRSIDSASTLNNIGSVYFKQGDYSKAIDSYQKSIQIIQFIKGKDTFHSTHSLNNIGNVYGAQGNYSKAIEYFANCLKIQEKIKGVGTIHSASTLNNIGNAYEQQGDYFNAFIFFKKCVAIQSSFGIFHNVQFTAQHLYNSFKEIKDPMKYKQILSESPERYFYLVSIGKSLSYRGLIQEANQCFQQVYAFSAKNNHTQVMIPFASFLEKEKQYKLAIRCLQYLLKVYPSSNFFQKRLDLWQKLSELINKGKQCRSRALNLKSQEGCAEIYKVTKAQYKWKEVKKYIRKARDLDNHIFDGQFNILYLIFSMNKVGAAKRFWSKCLHSSSRILLILAWLGSQLRSKDKQFELNYHYLFKPAFNLKTKSNKQASTNFGNWQQAQTSTLMEDIIQKEVKCLLETTYKKRNNRTETQYRSIMLQVKQQELEFKSRYFHQQNQGKRSEKILEKTNVQSIIVEDSTNFPSLEQIAELLLLESSCPSSSQLFFSKKSTLDLLLEMKKIIYEQSFEKDSKMCNLDDFQKDRHSQSFVQLDHQMSYLHSLMQEQTSKPMSSQSHSQIVDSKSLRFRINKHEKSFKDLIGLIKQSTTFRQLVFKNYALIIEFLSEQRQTLRFVAKHFFDPNTVKTNSEGEYLRFQLTSEKGSSDFVGDEEKDKRQTLWGGGPAQVLQWAQCQVKGIIELQQIGIFHLDLALRNTIRIKDDGDSWVYKIIDFDYSFRFEGKDSQDLAMTKQIMRTLLKEKKFQQLYKYFFGTNSAKVRGIANSATESNESKVEKLVEELGKYCLQYHRFQFWNLLGFVLDYQKCQLSKEQIASVMSHDIPVHDKQANKKGYQSLLLKLRKDLR